MEIFLSYSIASNLHVSLELSELSHDVEVGSKSEYDEAQKRGPIPFEPAFKHKILTLHMGAAIEIVVDEQMVVLFENEAHF